VAVEVAGARFWWPRPHLLGGVGRRGSSVACRFRLGGACPQTAGGLHRALEAVKRCRSTPAATESPGKCKESTTGAEGVESDRLSHWGETAAAAQTCMVPAPWKLRSSQLLIHQQQQPMMVSITI
jgi:hypothetical protein